MIALTRRIVLGLMAAFTLAAGGDAPVKVDDKTVVLDGWLIVISRLERVIAIIKASYLHRQYDKELLSRVRLHLTEIEAYLDKIESRIKW